MIYPQNGMKLTHTLFISALSVAFAAATLAQTSSTPPAKPATEDLPDAPTATAAALIHPNGPTVVMDTSMGRITCQFFQKQAPLAVANFIGLAEGTKDWTDSSGKKQHNKRYYDGTIFHRVIPEFMIQGGDPTGTGMGDPGYAFDDEIDPNLNFDQSGRLAMANSGPNTNGSQFFITEQAYDSLNGHYTLFGQCDDASVEVVRSIARVDRDEKDKPITPVILKKVTIVPEGQPLPATGEAANDQSAPRKMIAISGGVAVGMVIYHPDPVKPGDVRQSGVVVLDAIVDERGAVESLKVISGPVMLQQASIDTVKTWRYRPYLLNGQAVAVKTQISVTFK
jgi:peptidyl-prolyl cis-trans isomerase A (cyclophilin A)